MGRRTVMAVIVAIGGLAAFLTLADIPAPVGPASRVSQSPTVTPAAAVPDEWERADSQIARLSPERFPDLPAIIRARLLALDCTVPQVWDDSRPHNVITGQFIASSSSDWAVLCSRERESSILVFPNGSVDSMFEFGKSPDRLWLQGIGGDRIGFSHLIEVARPEHIEAYVKSFGSHELPPLDHDGINDIFIDKASVIRYWDGGRWLELQGAD